VKVFLPGGGGKELRGRLAYMKSAADSSSALAPYDEIK